MLGYFKHRKGRTKIGVPKSQLLKSTLVGNRALEVLFRSNHQRLSYHPIDGLLENRSTFIPKKPDTNVRGRKMNVTQLSRQRLAFSFSDTCVSLMAADL